MVIDGDGARTAVLELGNLSKSFGGTRALDGVSLRIEAGQVHGLLGHNGSGKSTLIKVLAGYHVPEPDSVLEIRGRAEPLPLAPGRARELGLAFVHQDLALIPTLTVLENLCVPQWTDRRQRVHWRSERARASSELDALGIEVDLNRSIGSLNKGERALIAVARAASEMGITASSARSTGTGVLVLDEPTVFLSRAGRDQLFEVMRRVASLGAGVLFVSHDLDEVIAHTDVVTVLRDGRVVGHKRTSDTNRAELIGLIVGEHQRVESSSALSVVDDAPFARVIGVNGGDSLLEDVSFEILEGEVLGATGLLGSGFDELPYVLFGAVHSAVRGSLVLEGKEIDLARLNPSTAIKEGLGLIPANRQRDGGIMTLPVADNMMVLSLERTMRWGRLSNRRIVDMASCDMAEFDVRPRRPSMAYGRLSGGNQQKALVAKWLRTSPRLLLLDEPTQGVDVGARRQIIGQLRTMCASGGAVLYCSADHSELAEVCDRVLVFQRGRLASILRREELSKERITQECIGKLVKSGVGHEERA